MGTMDRIMREFTQDETLRDLLTFMECDKLVMRAPGSFPLEIALLDMDQDSDFDAIALDISRNGSFELLFVDADGEGRPNAAYMDRNGEGLLHQLDPSRQEEADMIAAAAKLYCEVTSGPCDPSEVIRQLRTLSQNVWPVRDRLGLSA